MKYILFFVALLTYGTLFSQQTSPLIDGTWKAVSKIKTETTDGTVTEEDKEVYKDGEKTYAFRDKTVTITQDFGRHSEKLPIRIHDNQLFMGKREKNKRPYELSVNGSQLILTKTKQKIKKGKMQVDTEVLTLEK